MLVYIFLSISFQILNHYIYIWLFLRSASLDFKISIWELLLTNRWVQPISIYYWYIRHFCHLILLFIYALLPLLLYIIIIILCFYFASLFLLSYLLLNWFSVIYPRPLFHSSLLEVIFYFYLFIGYLYIFNMHFDLKYKGY